MRRAAHCRHGVRRDEPLGASWGHLLLLTVPVLLSAAALVARTGRRRRGARRAGMLAGAAVAAGLWTFFTVGAPVVVPLPQAPQGAECVVDAWGENLGRRVSWDGACGRALARHLLLSGGPSVLMLAVTAGYLTGGLGTRRPDAAAA